MNDNHLLIFSLTVTSVLYPMFPIYQEIVTLKDNITALSTGN